MAVFLCFSVQFGCVWSLDDGAAALGGESHVVVRASHVAQVLTGGHGREGGVVSGEHRAVAAVR